MRLGIRIGLLMWLVLLSGLWLGCSTKREAKFGTTAQKHDATVILSYYGIAACGGVRTSREHIHTAAHCVLGVFNDPREIQASVRIVDARGQAYLAEPIMLNISRDLAKLRIRMPIPDGDFTPVGEWPSGYQGMVVIESFRPIPWSRQMEWAYPQPDSDAWIRVLTECVQGQSGSPLYLGGRVVGIVILGGARSGRCVASAVRPLKNFENVEVRTRADVHF